jgi:nucleoside-diphosphate-sugar epimerase
VNVLVTGPSGFIGQHIHRPREARANLTNNRSIAWMPYSTRKLDREPTEPYQAVVHCAGLAHQMQKIDDRQYFEINHASTVKMADLAKRQGAKHFIFLSSSKVFGDDQHHLILTESTECQPSDAYGESKLMAERDLLEMNSDQFVVTIIRPPLVFGPGVKGNLIRLLKLVDSSWPLPFGSANANRSMVNVDNLIALIEHLLDKPTSGVFHAGEATPPTVKELVRTMRLKLNRAPRLVSVHPDKSDFAIYTTVLLRIWHRKDGGLVSRE